MKGLIPHEDLERFIYAGYSFFTLTGKSHEFTYRVTFLEKDEAKNDLWFVSVQQGLFDPYSKNYKFIGTIFANRKFIYSKKSEIEETDLSVKAFKFFIENIEDLPKIIKVHHIGRCARCGAELTDKPSVETGFGSYCITVTEKEQNINPRNKKLRKMLKD